MKLLPRHSHKHPEARVFIFSEALSVQDLKTLHKVLKLRWLFVYAKLKAERKAFVHVETINPVSVKSPRMLFAVTCESLNDDDDGDLIVLRAFPVKICISLLVCSQKAFY